MYAKTYKIADKIIEINSLYQRVHSQCSEYEFSGSADFTVSINPSDIDFERKKSAAENIAEGKPVKLYSDSYLESLAVYRKICNQLLNDNIILFHCSALSIDNTAYLFTAPSGTGKSTHTRLWREHFGERVTMINDDKPLLKIAADKIIAYGTPYGGKDNIHTNTSAKVGGIVILHQSKENTIKRLTSSEAYPMLLTQTYRPQEAGSTLKVLDMVDELSQLPVYSLGCTISQEAVELAYNTIVS